MASMDSTGDGNRPEVEGAVADVATAMPCALVPFVGTPSQTPLPTSYVGSRAGSLRGVSPCPSYNSGVEPLGRKRLGLPADNFDHDFDSDIFGDDVPPVSRVAGAKTIFQVKCEVKTCTTMVLRQPSKYHVLFISISLCNMFNNTGEGII